MPIRRYVEVGVFTSDALSAMSKAFEAAVWTLGIGRDKIKREGVAKFIIGLAKRTPILMRRLCIVRPSRPLAVRSTAGNLKTSRSYWRARSLSLMPICGWGETTSVRTLAIGISQP